VCPKCNAELDLMPRPGSATPATVTTSHDLVYFFNLLKDVERVCEAESHTKITSWTHDAGSQSVN